MLFSPILSLQTVPNTIASDPSPFLILETDPLLSECWRKRKIFIACVVEDPSHHACGQVHLDYIFWWILAKLSEKRVLYELIKLLAVSED